MTNFLSNNLPFGATPIDPNEAAGLKIKHITTLAELNEFEQLNINKAVIWLSRSRNKNILNVSFVLKLHRKMFSDVWQWAGQQRQSDKNIGVPWSKIPENLSQLHQTKKEQSRQQYIDALRSADAKDYAKLLTFVRS